MSFMQHGNSGSWDLNSMDDWDEDAVDEGDTFNAPTYAQDDSGVTWKKMDVEDKPPEWNGEDPLNQAETYINQIRMWKKTTSHDVKKQAKMVADRMKGKLKGLISDLFDQNEDKEFPIFEVREVDGKTESVALDDIIKRLEKEYQDFLDNPLPISWNELIYSPDRFKKANESFRQFVKRTERALEKVKKAGVLLSDQLKGLHLLSHLRLTTQQFELLVQWTLKEWTWDKIVAALERYESEPLVGPNYTKGHTHSSHFVAKWDECYTFFQDSVACLCQTLVPRTNQSKDSTKTRLTPIRWTPQLS